jgi:hypothetical protein
VHRNILDSEWVYAARTLGVLGFIFFLWVRAALSERLRAAFGQ